MGTEPVFNVGTDYGGNIQAALDAVSASQAFLARGGTVYVPRGQYVVTNPLLVRGGRIILRGENLDTLIHPSIDNQPVVKLDGNNPAGYGVHDFKMETLQIIGLSQRSGNIGLYCKGEGGYFPSGLRFENVFISAVSAVEAVRRAQERSTRVDADE